MENPVQIPPLPTLAAAPRRHLDSDSFRILSRIFSLCLDHPAALARPKPPTAAPEPQPQSPDAGVEVSQPVANAAGTEPVSEFVLDDDLFRSVEALLNDEVSEGELQGSGPSGDTAMRLLLDEFDSGEELLKEEVVVEGGEDAGFEDGEIPDERQAIDDPTLVVVSGVEDVAIDLPVHDKTGEMRLKDSDSKAVETNFKRQVVSYDDALGLLGEEKGNSVVAENKGGLRSDDNKSVEVPDKKKRVLTEERKAKKKIVKKRKRAQKDREQGVKRLKLQPNVKPKVLKQCNFYMMGRCQQGDLCKFSHDGVPLTKSQPCRHFACDSCLKGDDCAFDHELSKYPCHNFMSKGMCIRGDKCKFSHKITATEDSSISTTGKSHPPFLSEKRLNSKNTSIVADGPSKITTLVASDPPKSTTSNRPFPLNNLLATNTVKHQQEPLRAPKGIRFLSFGKGQLDNNTQENMTMMENHSSGRISNQESQAADKDKNDLYSARSTLVSQAESSTTRDRAVHHRVGTVIGKMNPKNNRFSSGPVTAPFSKSRETEVSDASKILDEFLFGAG